MRAGMALGLDGVGRTGNGYSFGVVLGLLHRIPLFLYLESLT